MKKIFSLMAIVAIALGAFGSFTYADNETYTYYADSQSIGETVNCATFDGKGDYISCFIENTEKAYAIVLDNVPPQHVESGDKAYAIVLDSVPEYTYYADSQSIGETVNCEPFAPESDYIMCNIGETDKAYAIVLDNVPPTHIQSGNKAYAIVLDSVPGYIYYADEQSVGETVNCEPLDVNRDYIMCNTGETDKAYAIVLDNVPPTHIESGNKAYAIVLD